MRIVQIFGHMGLDAIVWTERPLRNFGAAARSYGNCRL